MPGPADLRVSDAERERVVERLRAAAGEGRLATDELEERVSEALAARTHGDLDRLLTDLPGPRLPAPRQSRPPAPRADPVQRRELLARQTVGFLTPNAVCIAIWAATGAANFWPKWVLLFTGIWYGVFLIRYLARIEHEHYDARGNARDRRHPRARGQHRRRRYHG
jgi:DUF1707 SHOCT-like domain